MSDVPEMPVPSDTPYESLKTEIDGYIDYSRTWMRVWACVYYLLRTTMIVLAAMVAAKDSLQFIKDNVSVLALLVAIGTSLDTWLKTGTRYKGHFSYNDKFISLYTDLKLTEPSDKDKIEALHQKFSKLIEDYSTVTLPT